MCLGPGHRALLCRQTMGAVSRTVRLWSETFSPHHVLFYTVAWLQSYPLFPALCPFLVSSLWFSIILQYLHCSSFKTSKDTWNSGSVHGNGGPRCSTRPWVPRLGSVGNPQSFQREQASIGFGIQLKTAEQAFVACGPFPASPQGHPSPLPAGLRARKIDL